VAVADSRLGQILVGANAMTIYLFEKDGSGDASSCSGACAEAWPPVTVKGALAAGDGVDASKLTTFKRDDGATRVAYNGHPLYHYAGEPVADDAGSSVTPSRRPRAPRAVTRATERRHTAVTRAPPGAV
jgi:predicted lipoprotein with Yx(FWY)xxD motif